MNNAKRIAIVTGVPAPYREPIFEKLAVRQGVELKVFYCTDSHHNVAWSGGASSSFEYVKEFPRNFTPRRFQRLPFFGYVNFGLSAALRDFEPDFVIVYGYNQSSHWMAFRYCLSNNVPFALRSDSNVHIDLGTSWQNNIRRQLLRWLVKRAAAVLPVGSANRRYWEAFGAKPSQIHLAPYAVDNENIARAVGESRPDPNGRVRFLYVGRLIPRKGVDLLIEAFNRIASDRCSLTIVGEGQELDALKAAQSPNAASRTTWTGKLSNEETLKRYADADVFVLPSRYEPWGLVVNEAMAAGLPVIADRRCGAAIDLIDDGNTGRRLDELSTEALAEAMSRYVADPESAAEHGKQAQRRIQYWNFDRTVDGFLEAVDAARNLPHRGEGDGNPVAAIENTSLNVAPGATTDRSAQ